jgi:cytochrome c oxidase cbb3-type subunit 3
MVRWMMRAPQQDRRPWCLGMIVIAALSGCSKEVRTLDAGQPSTRPVSSSDARIPHYQANAYQIAQGGRYFAWYGCAACHATGSKVAPDFGTGLWRHGGDFDQVYYFIDHGHGAGPEAFGHKIPVEQIWQLTAYVRDVSQQPPEKRRRQDFDQQGEPQGAAWSGPVR